MPISRFVAVSFRPASSVLRRTFVRTGRERFETARLTTDRPRARFSCMTESFTWAYSKVTDRVQPGGGHGMARPRKSGRYLLPIFSFRHHRHHGVDVVDGRSRSL